MLGRDHALLGAVGFLAVGPLVVHGMPWETVGIATVTSAAFALAPDIDEPGSTVSRKLGFISRSISHVIRNISGGHRQATHSLFASAIVGALTWWADGHAVAMAIIVGASFMLALRMILPRILRFSLPLLALPLVASWWVYHHPQIPLTIWEFATAGGVIWHMAGDTITVEGVPWLWVPFVHPLQHIRIAIPLVGHCGSERESILAVIMSIGVLWLSYGLIMKPAYHSSVVAYHGNLSFINNLLHHKINSITNGVKGAVNNQIGNAKKSVGAG